MREKIVMNIYSNLEDMPYQERELRLEMFKAKRKQKLLKSEDPVPVRDVPELCGLPNELQDCLVPDSFVNFDPDLGAYILLMMLIFIVGRQKDITTGESSLTIACSEQGKCRIHTIPRQVCASPRSFLREVSKYCDFIDESNYKYIHEFFLMFEKMNATKLPYKRITNKQGIPGREADLRSGCIIGKHHYRPQDMEETIVFETISEEFTQRAMGMEPKGSLEKWISAVSIAKYYETLAICLYASFCSILVKLLGISNIVIELCGDSSSGKTSCIQAALSIYGYAEENDLRSMLLNWEGSRAYIESVASMLNNLPLGIDDTKRIRDKRKLSSLIYTLYSGRGRGRATANGLIQDTPTWANTCFISGEDRGSDISAEAHGGQIARTISIPGLPFHEKSKTAARIVLDLKKAILTNYGLAGPVFVQHLIDHPELIDELREEHAILARRYADEAGANSLAGRQGEAVAAIQIAARLAHEIFPFDWDYMGPINWLWEGILERTQEGSLPNRALRAVLSYAQRNPQRFYRRDEFNGTLSGVWMMKGEDSYLAWHPDALEEFLASKGFNYNSIIDEWHGLGWLATEKGRKTCYVSFGSRLNRLRMIKIKWSAFVEMGLVEPSP